MSKEYASKIKQSASVAQEKVSNYSDTNTIR